LADHTLPPNSILLFWPTGKPHDIGIMNVLSIALLTALAGGSHESPAETSQPADHKRPKLVLQITIDQFRGDLIRRYADRWGEGGFRKFLDEGAVFANAHHAHANTETIVGHSTLATGAFPATHGMIGNVWMNRKDGGAQYTVEDAKYPVISTKPLIDQDTEIDPTQRAARSDGRSPRALLVSTFGDELKLFTGAHAKVFGVSIKDRAAISLAGHTGQAYWFSKSTGEFVTSRYYQEAYPEWVKSWNAAGHVSRYANTSWELAREQSGYLFGDRDDRPYETALPGFGRTFPHAYGAAEDKYFTTFLTLSPAGDDITLGFAKALIENEQLGQDEVTDYLSVSFSATDYVGHMFGPSSLEAEDNLLRLDRTLADLLAFVDSSVGLDETLIVLSADHGGPEVPGYLRSLGFDAAYIATSDEIAAAVQADLEAKFGVKENLVRGFFHPYVYLDRAAIADNKLDLDAVASVVAATLESQAGIAHAFTSRAMRKGEYPELRVANAVRRNHNSKRSGDVYIVTDPNHFVNDFDGLHVAATHGSPWRYDTHVPIIFLGSEIKAQTIQREVLTVDVAASLAALVGTLPPSGCDGEPLVELFR